MRLGIRLPYHTATASGEEKTRIAVTADEAGMHSGWVADHLVFPAGGTASSTSTTRSGGYPRPFDEVTLVVMSRLMIVPGVGKGQPGKLDASSAAVLADELARYEEAGVDVLLCETTVRTGDALARLVDVAHTAGADRSMLCA